ncbi:MAG: exo-beta-1,3-glucanase [Methylomonas sp.]|nr:MAG: exo-beta-1,3-glucanase [Methylomonas sp.]
MSTTRIVLCCLLVFLVHAGSTWFLNRPQDAGVDVPSGKLMSLSFAPFREGYSPLEETFPLPEHIDEDLRLLADKTHTIRTYASLGGLEPAPALARKYGLSVIQGGWLGYGYMDNKKEMDALIKSANENPDVVKRVIVGNEVLLRGDMDVDRLIGYIRQVKSAVKQPVSYADVWSMYMKYPQLIKEVDFITIHILPYWEDEPVSVEHASEHLEKIVKQVEDEARGLAPGKPILIGESGWPSAGRQRGMAIPGVVNEAKFIRDMIQVVNRHGFDYNIVEAFNQPWKSNLEGVVGANWGLLSADRQPVFPLTGSVYENPNWSIHFVVSVLIWLLIVAVCFRKMQFESLANLMTFLILTQLFSMCLVTLAHFLWYTSYSFSQRTYTVVMVVANIILGAFLIQRYLDILNNRSGNEDLARKLRIGYLSFILLALFKTFGLAVNGRYLSFPVEQFALPALGVLGLMLCQWLNRGSLIGFDQLSGGGLQGRRDQLIAYFLVIAAVAMIMGEIKAFMDGRDFIQAHPGLSEGLPVALRYTLYNQQLLAWLACLLILAWPFWASSTHKANQR